MASLDDRFAELLRLLRERMPRGPEWTEGNDRDPGTTLLALFRQLADELVGRGARLSAAGRAELARIGARLAEIDRGDDPADVRVNGERWRAVQDLADADADAAVYHLDPRTGVIRFGDGRHGRRPESGARVEVRYRDDARAHTDVALATSWPPEPWTRTISTHADGSMRIGPGHGAGSSAGVERVSFFEGWLLTAADFQAEQDYVREKLRRLSRAALGTGVVSGLSVTVGSDDEGASVTISPGVAIDPSGEMIVVPHAEIVNIRDDADGAAIQLIFCERPARLVPPGTDRGSAERARPTRVVEDYAVLVSDTSDPLSVVLGRLVRDHDGWRVVPPT